MRKALYINDSKYNHSLAVDPGFLIDMHRVLFDCRPSICRDFAVRSIKRLKFERITIKRGLPPGAPTSNAGKQTMATEKLCGALHRKAFTAQQFFSEALSLSIPLRGGLFKW